MFKSQHDADAFVDVLKRMAGYANQSTPLHPQRRLAQRLLEERGDAREQAFRERADYLATINLNEGTTWEYPAQDAAAPDRAVHPRHHHRVGSAARRRSSRMT